MKRTYFDPRFAFKQRAYSQSEDWDHMHMAEVVTSGRTYQLLFFLIFCRGQHSKFIDIVKLETGLISLIYKFFEQFENGLIKLRV